MMLFPRKVALRGNSLIVFCEFSRLVHGLCEKVLTEFKWFIRKYSEKPYSPLLF